MNPSPFDHRTFLKSVPLDPGVYLMKDAAGEIIYIGKASSLKKRVSSYFSQKEHDFKTAALVRNIAAIEYIITDSEIEALILESSLVRKHRPKFNIRLKDDKRYPYIAVTLEEEYPRVIFTRKLARGRNRYFGPYTDAKAARNMVSLINTTFKLKTCRRDLPLKNGERPCLNFQMKRCHGTCMAKISREEYREIVNGAIGFLEGNVEPVIGNLKKLMEEHSKKYEFEQAAKIRDVILDIGRMSEAQKVYEPVGADRDFIGITVLRSEAVIVVFEYRGGILIGRKITIFENAEFATTPEIMRSFIIDFYQSPEVPPQIVAMAQVEDGKIIEEYLAGRSGHRVGIGPARSPDDRAIMNLLRKNMDIIIAEREAARAGDDRLAGLQELKEVLALPDVPSVIECFDISNIQGKFAVASMTRFRDGMPDKSGYRRYRMRGYEGANDPGMIHEVVARRLQYLVNESQELPDLMVIDGGPTQLTRAIEAARALGARMLIVSLAKRFEEIYTDPAKEPVRLPETSMGLRILQRIRDEAHRFAVTYHRTLRDASAVESVIDDIPTIGESKKRLLLEHFKSIEAIKGAPVEAIAAVPGIGQSAAEKIYGFFHNEDH